MVMVLWNYFKFFADVTRCIVHIGTIITDNRNNQQEFITAREYDKLEIDRKRSASEAAEEPKRKKTNKDVKIPTDSTESVKTSIQEKRVVSGDIGQCLNNKKKYPNLDALYEVYGKITHRRSGPIF